MQDGALLGIVPVQFLVQQMEQCPARVIKHHEDITDLRSIWHGISTILALYLNGFWNFKHIYKKLKKTLLACIRDSNSFSLMLAIPAYRPH